MYSKIIKVILIILILLPLKILINNYFVPKEFYWDKFSRDWKNRDYNLVNKILSIVMPIILIFCTFVVAFNVEFTTLLFGKDFAKAGPVLAWLMPAAIFTLPNYIFGFPMLSMINKEKHANYLFSLKGNHETAVDITKAFFACHELDKEFCEKYGIQKLDCKTEIGHGRIEKREYYLCSDLKWFIDKKDWVNLR